MYFVTQHMEGKMKGIYLCVRFSIFMLAVSGGMVVAACDESALDEPALEDVEIPQEAEEAAIGTENAQMEATDSDAVSEQDVIEESEGDVDPEVWCGGGGPPYHCLGHCCSHSGWTDLGVPNWGQCNQMVNDYCQWRGGNCGACWGYL
jgi:hypothetical protein